MDILQRLAEGASCSEPAKIEVDPATEKEIEESTMPMSMLIESFYNRVESDINRAIEVYEMADIIGTAQVLQEGANVHEAASAVMEGNVKDFFNKIIEKIKDIYHWFTGIIKKIFHRGKTETAASKEKATKAIPEAKKVVEKSKDTNKEILYRGPIFSSEKGDALYDRIVNLLDASILESEDEFDDIVKEIEAGLTDTAKRNELTKESLNALKDGPVTAEQILDEAGIEGKTVGELCTLIKDEYITIIGNNDKPLIIDSKKLDNMKAFVDSAVDVEKMCNAIVKKCTNRINNMIKKVEAAKKRYDNIGGGAISKSLTNMVSSLNTIINIYSQIINTKVQAYVKTSNAYSAFIDSLSKKGSSSNQKNIEESLNLSYMFETLDEVQGPYAYEESIGNDTSTGYGNTSMFGQLGAYLSI